MRDCTLAITGAVDGTAFMRYAERVLVPTLWSGQIVVLDNLGSHQRADTRQTIEAAGTSQLFLLAYSLDFNPIELAFAKVKEHLRPAAALPRRLDDGHGRRHRRGDRR